MPISKLHLLVFHNSPVHFNLQSKSFQHKVLKYSSYRFFTMSTCFPKVSQISRQKEICFSQQFNVWKVSIVNLLSKLQDNIAEVKAFLCSQHSCSYNLQSVTEEETKCISIYFNRTCFC